MFAVVKIERFGGHVRIERGAVEGQIGERKGHGDLA